MQRRWKAANKKGMMIINDLGDEDAFYIRWESPDIVRLFELLFLLYSRGFIEIKNFIFFKVRLLCTCIYPERSIVAKV